MATTASWVGSADNWPEAPMFSYSRAEARVPLIVGIGMIGNPLLLLAVSGLNVLSVLMPDIMSGWERSRSFWYLFVMARREHAVFIACAVLAAYSVLALLFGLWLTRRLARSRPALAITADGLFAYRRSKPWRSISWREVGSITRRETRGKYGRMFTTVLIQGASFTLEMGEKIAGWEEARRLLTRFAQQHSIKLRAIGVDPGNDYDITQL